jgi:uncharacterized protein (DUF1501 family)
MSNERNACAEYRSLSRRGFLVGAAGLTAAAGLLPKVAFAQSENSDRDIIISVFLRGGSDGLSMVVPHADPRYYVLRTTEAIPEPGSGDPNRAIDLDGFYGIPQSMSGLLEAYQQGHLCFVHAVGAPNWSRSHFDAQNWMEVGATNNPAVSSGWLARHLLTVPPRTPNTDIRAISLTYGLRQIVSQAPLTLPIPNLDNYDYAGWWGNQAELAAAIQESYNSTSDPVRSSARYTDATIRRLNTIDFQGYQPAGGATYPDHYFGTGMKQVAAMLKGDIGVEAIHLDLDGWDTHSDQGCKQGTMADLMRALANATGAFWKDMVASNRTRWTMVVLSEFGRTAFENSSRGTDHGTGNAMYVLGPSVRGGRVVANWPGLESNQLYQGVDLAATIDYRDIVAEVLNKRVANNSLNVIFPNFTPTFRGIVNA